MVAPAGSQSFAIRAESDTPHKTAVPAQRSDLPARFEIPEFHSAVGAGRSESFTVRTECDAHDAILMTFKSKEFFPIVWIPNLDRLVKIPESKCCELSVAPRGNKPVRLAHSCR